MADLNALVSALTDHNAQIGCEAMEELKILSRESPAVYACFDQFVPLLGHSNSLVRNRGLILIAENARWDREGKLEACIEAYLTHILDAKPITARQCIQNLPLIAKAKPGLRGRIRDALTEANPDGYAESMRPLVEKDIFAALKAIAAMD